MGDSEKLDNLPLYYKILFPHKLFYKWLYYGGYKPDYFKHREFSFTLPGDIYLRYQSFSDAAEFHKSLLSKVPIKIDIGAVFDRVPKDNRKSLDALRAEERELIFDIDMDDYDDIRTCCKGPAICNNCWRFVVIAAKILDAALREDFGFTNILWVYSGRRGIHGWVCDARARRLPQEARTAIVDYLSLVEGGEFKSKRVTLLANKNPHPMIERAIKIIESVFVDFMIKDQKLFDTKESTAKVIELCSDSELKNNLRAQVLNRSHRNGLERWKSFENTVLLHLKERNYTRTHARFYLQEIMLQMCYPRLDANVTRGINHLLKAPFCVHPKTHRICVPIDIASISKFDPFKVPTIDELCSQIDAYDQSQANQSTQNESEDKVEAYQKTDLAKSIMIFRKFIASCEKETYLTKSAEAKDDTSW